MDTAARRSALRILAPVALIAFGLALVLIISSANGGSGGGGTSSPSAEKARDLGTGPSQSARRKSSSRGKLPKTVYIVKNGDTLGSISQTVGVSESRIQELNPNIDQFSLSPGQKLKIR